MLHVLLSVFIVAHGAVHGIMFGLPLIPEVERDMAENGFRPAHSWLIGDSPSAAFIFALGVTLAFVAAGGAVFWRASWWPTVLLGASGGSMLLLVLYASKYWAVGYLISAVLVIAAWRALRAA